ncbi:histidine phosphatase family protein [Candidatus Saccharibacteria bacterium]|nr:histidine phosphatase family protein [Candidatus Saccharibacteria bacterium]
MKLFLTRHTRTNYNELGLCNSDPAVDVHLSDEGIDQAKQLAEKLKHEDFERILVSTLPRTRQTAEIINTHHIVPLIEEPALSDYDSGFEGRSADDYLAALASAPDMWAYRGTGKESIQDVRDRVKAFLQELRQRDYGPTLIVTHGTVLQCIYAELEGLSNDAMWELPIPQGDFTVVYI